MRAGRQWRRERVAHLRDWLDRALVRGQVNVILWLAGAAVAVALVASLIVTALHLAVRGHSPGFGEAFWQALVRTIDPGQITDDHAGFALLGLLITVLGLLLVSTLISLVNNRIERRVESIRRGRDEIPPREGHIVVLGWSDICAKVVEELADSGLEDELVDLVVLADEQVSTMRHELLEVEELEGRGQHWPILRSGSPWDTRDLQRLARVDSARAVVVVDDGSDDSVANTIKTVMAILAACDGPTHGRAPEDHPTIVIEVEGRESRLIAPMRARLGRFGFRIVEVDSLELRTELAAQVSRRAGLSNVFKELLNFSGEEFYLVPPPAGVATFGHALTALRDRVPIGLIDPATKDVDLWPDWTRELDGQHLIVISTDDQSATSAVGVDVTVPPLSGNRPQCCERPLEQQRLLVVGWNDGAEHLVDVLDQYAGEGSTITVVSDQPIEHHELKLASFETQTFLTPEMGVQAWLDQERDHFDHAIVLADDSVSAAASDAETFVALLALRPAGTDHGNPTTVVAQLRERQNKHLARQSLADDLVISDAITAMALAQLAVNPDLEFVLESLLGDTPFTIELVANPYYGMSSSVTFGQVSTATAAHGEIALGWITADGLLRLAPPKDAALSHRDLAQIVVFTRLRLG